MRPWLALAMFGLACAGAAPVYHLGENWREPSPHLLESYSDFFEVIFDDRDTREPDLRPLRRDLERAPVDARNYDALHAVAIAYFELNYRAETTPGDGLYLGNSFRAAHLAAVPWRAYSEIEDPPLRGAILDFFADVGSGDKPGSAKTAHRLARIVDSLEAKESDPGRRERIRNIAAELRARSVH